MNGIDLKTNSMAEDFYDKDLSLNVSGLTINPACSPLSPLVDPDVTVVIGGKEFQECSRHLRSWSDYFDAAFRSGMKEAETRKFEFPHREPDEWVIIRSMWLPFSNQHVNDKNVDMALSWFHELGCPLGLMECEKVLRRQIIAYAFTPKTSCDPLVMTTSDYTVLDGYVEKLLVVTATSIQYDLPTAKGSCFWALLKILTDAPSFLQQEDHRMRIAHFISSHAQCREVLWAAALEDHVPAYIPDSQKQELMDSGILPAITMSELLRKDTEKNFQELKKEVDRLRS